MSRTLVAALLTIYSLFVSAATHAAEPKRPNILFIYADDQSYKTISCYGASPDWVKTPNIDKLANRGVRFERSYLGAWCMPSRASLLTGKLQHAVESMTMEGAYPGSKYDPAKCPFVPAEFRKAGYHTAQIGKWHTGTDTGYGRDWDHQIVWNRPAHPENAGKYYVDQLITFNGETRKVEGYSTDNYTDWAVEYIEGKHRDPQKPWYLWLCYGAVHGPTTPAPRHKGTLQGKEAPVPADIYGPWPDKPKYLDVTSAWMKGEDGRPALAKAGANTRRTSPEARAPGKSFDAWIQQVNECNMALDEGVGRVMKALEASGQLENTLVVYTADQGYGLGEHGFNQKVAPYDATISSPLIISRPGLIPEGKVCRHAVNSPDLIDLFCRTADVTIPWKTHGRDIRPLLANPETKDWNSPVILTHTARSYGSETDLIPTGEKLTAASNTPWYVMLRDGKFKYVRTLVEGEIEELYDLDADPEELANLALRPDQRDLLESLRKKAIDELRRTDAKFVDGLPPTKLEGVKKADAGKRPAPVGNARVLPETRGVPSPAAFVAGDDDSSAACAAPADAGKTPADAGKKPADAAATRASRSLDIYWIDVEGGAATLIVTPAGESVLIDSGNPGVRDSNRIFQVAAKEAGLKKIDHLITTHYHRDHFGGAAPLSAVIPIGIVWDNAEWPEQREKADQEYYEFKCDARKQISPGDSVTLKPAAGFPDVTLRCLGARQKFVDLAAGAAPNEICASNNPAPVDNSDNANSVVTLLSYGDFDFLVVGDLTRNREFDLVCPSNRVGKVDVFQSAHHGLDNSNNPVLVRSIEPRVVVVNNGITKGNMPLMFATLEETRSIQAVYQMHKTLRDDGTSHNVKDEFIANHEKECKGEHIKLAVAPDGKRYEVKVPATGHARTFESK